MTVCDNNKLKRLNIFKHDFDESNLKSLQYYKICLKIKLGCGGSHPQ